MYPQPPAPGQPLPGQPIPGPAQPVPPAPPPVPQGWQAPPPEAPTTAWLGAGPTSGASGGYPVISIPPAPNQDGRPWRTRVRVLAVLVGVLVLALAGTGVWLGVANQHLHHEKSALGAAATRRQQNQAQAKAKLAEQFRQANLDGKLQRVRDLTQQTGEALVSWSQNGTPTSGLKHIRDLGNQCDEAVIDYDATAAQFPVEMLAGLPIKIDVADGATDCSR